MHEAARLPAQKTDFAALRVLIVEDESIVSLLVEDMLIDIGCGQVQHAANVAQAMTVVEKAPPDAAVLDVNLTGQMVFPVAERLEALGVPFVFASGYSRTGLPGRWRGHSMVQKPFTQDGLEKALRLAIGSRAAR